MTKRKAITPSQRDDLRTRLDTYLNDQHRDLFHAAFLKKFNLEIQTYVNIFGDMGLVSTRVDGEPMTEAMQEFCTVWEAGYVAAWNKLREFLTKPPRRTRAGN